MEQSSETQHATIELTKKRFKLEMLITVFVIIISGAVLFGSEVKPAWSVWGFILGIGWWIILKARIWWSHG